MKEVFEKEELLEKSNLKRIDHTYISHEITHLLHLDKGFFYTIRELVLRPGKTVREFLLEDRTKLVKPILFLVLCAVIFTVLIHLFHITLTLYGLNESSFNDNDNSKAIINWTSNNLGYSQLILGIFISFWIRIFFLKFKYNIYEVVVLMSYILGQGLLIFLFFLIAFKILHFKVIATIGTIIYMLYIIWGVGQFFGEKKPLNYFKSIITYVLGVLSYLLTLKIIVFLVKFL